MPAARGTLAVGDNGGGRTMAGDGKGIGGFWRALGGKAKLVVAALVAAPVLGLAGAVALFVVALSGAAEERARLDLFLEPMFESVAADGWTADAFDSFANPIFRESLDQAEGEKLLARWRGLGKLVTYEGLDGFEFQQGDGWMWGGGTVRAGFEAGTVVFAFEAEAQDGRWQLKWLKGGRL